MTNRGIQEPSILATHLIQEANRYNKPLQLVSFDIEKAFDRVSHKIILDALRAFGVPEITISALQRLALIGYAYAEVTVGKGLKSPSKQAWVRATLSPASSFYWPLNLSTSPFLKTTGSWRTKLKEELTSDWSSSLMIIWILSDFWQWMKYGLYCSYTANTNKYVVLISTSGNHKLSASTHYKRWLRGFGTLG
jgi:hypothetical protein